ncbi:hypothetical protein J6590_093409 [Homalodisca vitripennis]|nr:hypothetical protein J6590_093409 [Homalodisca vitripennis]
MITTEEIANSRESSCRVIRTLVKRLLSDKCNQKPPLNLTTGWPIMSVMIAKEEIAIARLLSEKCNQQPPLNLTTGWPIMSVMITKEEIANSRESSPPLNLTTGWPIMSVMITTEEIANNRESKEIANSRESNCRVIRALVKRILSDKCNQKPPLNLTTGWLIMSVMITTEEIF